MHVGIANPRWRGKRSQRSRRNPQFNISDKRPMSWYYHDSWCHSICSLALRQSGQSCYCFSFGEVTLKFTDGIKQQPNATKAMTICINFWVYCMQHTVYGINCYLQNLCSISNTWIHKWASYVHRHCELDENLRKYPWELDPRNWIDNDLHNELKLPSA